MVVTWDPPSDAEIDVDKPIKAVDIRRIRDLSQAMAEGAAGAPTIGAGWVFVENTFDFSVDGAVASVESALFADRLEYGFIVEDLTFSGGTASLNLEIFKATDSSYHASNAVLGPLISAVSDDSWGFVELLLSRIFSGNKIVRYGVHTDANISAGSDQMKAILNSDVDANVGMNIFSLATDQKVGKVRFGSGSASTMTAGKIIMYERAV